MPYEAFFSSTLFRIHEPGGWVFAPVPDEFAPVTAGAWGRIPVIATVDGETWKTSVWREKSGRTLLAAPKAIRRGKDEGDVVEVRLQFSHL